MPAKLVRLTIINRSGLPIEISLTGRIKLNEFQSNSYYLRVSKGDALVATVKDFTILQDTYSMRFYYLELWDPVYGKHCGAASLRVEARKALRVAVPKCTFSAPKLKNGERE